MAEIRAPEAQAEAAAQTLSEVFPGKAVVLNSIGKTVVVSEWGARALVHEVPAKFGRVIARLRPFAGELRERGLDAALPAVLQAAGEDIAELVLWSAGLEPAVLDRLTAADLMRLTAEVVRQNRDFFAAAAETVAALGAELPGSA